MMFRRATTLAIFATALAAAVPPAHATEPVAHYAPAENLERIDVALIDKAQRSIDMAAYVLTDYLVIEALKRAAARGVAVRIYRTHAEDERFPPSEPYKELRTTPGVEIRAKRSHVFMHLKAYVVDGTVLRTGAANFSASGLKRQDNDLIILDTPAAVAAFTANFARIWDEGEVER